MSKLKGVDRIKLEKFLDMGSGYVCDFSDRTFGDFVLESTGIDLYTEDYSTSGTSKANRLRTFWKKEPNHVTAKLLRDLLEYWFTQKVVNSKIKAEDKALYELCLKIVRNLQDSLIENSEALQPNSDDANFADLAVSIRESIDRDKPEQALDRLHTFVVKYLRTLCAKHDVQYSETTPLHSLMGGYIKFLEENTIIKSEMSLRILKSSISVLESFNTVRNRQSLAHDNPVLNYNESVLIFNSISNAIRFLESIENKDTQIKKQEETKWEDISFHDNSDELSLDEARDLGLI